MTAYFSNHINPTACNTPLITAVVLVKIITSLIEHDIGYFIFTNSKRARFVTKQNKNQ